MDGEKREKLLTIVKRDDAKGFGAIADSDLFGVVFGRFPLLSLLYLYDAKRIVRRYLSDLIKDRPRTKEDPIAEAEERFRSLAGKALRHFSGRIVSPLEMLAVLGKGRELKRIFPYYPNAQRLVPAIHRVYFTRLGKGVTLVGDRLILPPEPLSFGERRRGVLFASLCLAVGLVFAGVTVFISLFFGLGTDANPDKARSAQRFYSLVESGEKIELASDLSCSEGIGSYDNVIEGKGHTLSLSAPLSEQFEGEVRNAVLIASPDFEGESVISTLNGSLSGVTFVLPAEFKGKAAISVNNGTITDCSFLYVSGYAGESAILVNNGTIEGSSVYAEEWKATRSSDYSALLTSTNKGRIESCTAIFSAELTGAEYELAEEESKFCYFAPFAGINEGKVLYCSSKGSISAKNVDIAGFVGENASTGEITGCSAEITLFQESTFKGWSPNVAGVACKNDGTIGGCVVKGSITAKESSPELSEGDRLSYALAAGISCENLGTISNCDLSATVKAEALRGIALAGGIVTENTRTDEDLNRYAIVKSCTIEGSVRAEASEWSAYAGGVASVNSGSLIEQSINQSAVAAVGKGVAYAGGIVARNDIAEFPLNEYFKQEFAASLSRSLGKGSVTATSETGNAFAGGIAGYNGGNSQTGCVISECGQTAAVVAAGEGDPYVFSGGIVGQNKGTVGACFFVGTLPETDQRSFAGAICGVTSLVRTIFGDYTTLSNDVFLQGDAHACGALSDGTSIYTEASLAPSGENALALLDYGTVAFETLEALKETEIYYE